MKLILPSKKNNEQGQILLILLLVISVILVIGLSVVSRSVTDIKISQQSQESARALLVAQTGLEKAIKASSNIGSIDNKVYVSGIGYSVAKNTLGKNQEYVFPNSISANEPVTLWLVNHNTDGSLEIPINPLVTSLKFGWNDSQTALEATLIYKSGGNFLNERFVFDRNSSRTNFSGTIEDNCTISGITFANCSGNLSPLPGIPYLVQLRLLFNDQKQKIGVKSDQVLPEQGSCYVSTATVQESGVTRSLQQCQLWPTVPSIFNYQLFSGSNLE